MKIKKEQTDIADGWPGSEWPDLDGLPPVSQNKVRECLVAKEKGSGLLYGYLLYDRHRYVTETGEWLTWRLLNPSTGHGTWSVDHQGIEAEKAVELVAMLYLREAKITADLAQNENDKVEKNRLGVRQKALNKAVDFLRTERGVRSTLKFARPYVAVSAVKLDQQAYLLVCLNVAVELNHAGKTRPAMPADLCTRHCGCEWRGLDCVSPLLDRVSFEIHSDNQKENDYFWMWLGRSLVGDAKLQEFLVLSGAGRNGKGVLLGAISFATGSYSGPIQSELLLDQRNSRDANAPSPAILRLKGLRLAIASENDERRRFSAARVKWLSGDDELTGRGIMGKHDVDFNPTHSLILMTNSKPKAPPGDFAFWERLRLIEYKQTYAKNRQPNKVLGELPADEDLKSKLQDEAPAVLAKLVRGLMGVQRDGNLTPPPSVIAATAAVQRQL